MKKAGLTVDWMVYSLAAEWVALRVDLLVVSMD